MPRRIVGSEAAQAAAFVNGVYGLAEHTFWDDQWTRTDDADMAKVIETGELFGLFEGVDLIGCVRLTPMGDGLLEFGMLCTAPSRRNERLGSRLVEFAEQLAVAMGGKTMQLYLLQGTVFQEPGKARVAAWYQRLGYVHQNDVEVSEVSEILANQLKIDAVFGRFEKTLAL